MKHFQTTHHHVKHMDKRHICSLLMLLIVAWGSQAEVPAGERQALVDLYHSTHGQLWNDQTNNWLQGDPCDNQWTGVSCSEGHISKLELNDAGLSGQLPASLSQLSQLNTLDVGNNHIHGSIPTSITALSKLQTLMLASNQLTGYLPVNLGDMTALQIVFLDNNRLLGAIPESVTQLQQLSLFTYGYNSLYPETAEVEDFLSASACIGNQPNICPSKLLQVLPPDDFRVELNQDGSLTLKWQRQPNILEGGGYEIWMAESADQPHTLLWDTGGLENTYHLVDPETANRADDFLIRTYINPYHEFSPRPGGDTQFFSYDRMIISEAVNLSGDLLADPSLPINPDLSGSWSDPDGEGHGLVIEILGDEQVLVYWYVTDTFGSPVWLAGNGRMTAQGLQVDMTESIGTYFPPDFNSELIEQHHWGVLNIHFTSTETLLLSWDPVDSRRYPPATLNMRQFTRISNTQPSANHLLSGAHSGSWFDPSQAGQGLTVEVLSDDVGLIYWYVFSPQYPEPLWILGSGQINGSQIQADMYTVSGVLFPSAYQQADPVFRPWGTATLTLGDCHSGSFSWQPLETTQYQAGQMPVQRLTSLAGQACEDEPVP
jgi:hypothetical protein